jgi:hypothetical protein
MSLWDKFSGDGLVYLFGLDFDDRWVAFNILLFTENWSHGVPVPATAELPARHCQKESTFPRRFR